jgi:hypothetical protein
MATCFCLVEEVQVMPDISSLANRIDAEFATVEEKVKRFQTEQVESHKGRQ